MYWKIYVAGIGQTIAAKSQCIASGTSLGQENRRLRIQWQKNGTQGNASPFSSQSTLDTSLGLCVFRLRSRSSRPATARTGTNTGPKYPQIYHHQSSRVSKTCGISSYLDHWAFAECMSVMSSSSMLLTNVTRRPDHGYLNTCSKPASQSPSLEYASSSLRALRRISVASSKWTLSAIGLYPDLYGIPKPPGQTWSAM